MRTGTLLVLRQPMVRGTTYARLGDIDQARLDSAAAERATALEFMMGERKDARREAADRAAEERTARVNQMALDAAMRAGDQAAVTQAIILQAGQAGMKRVLFSVGALALAGFIVVAVSGRKRQKAPPGTRRRSRSRRRSRGSSRASARRVSQGPSYTPTDIGTEVTP